MNNSKEDGSKNIEDISAGKDEKKNLFLEEENEIVVSFRKYYSNGECGAKLAMKKYAENLLKKDVAEVQEDVAEDVDDDCDFTYLPEVIRRRLKNGEHLCPGFYIPSTSSGAYTCKLTGFCYPNLDFFYTLITYGPQGLDPQNKRENKKHLDDIIRQLSDQQKSKQIEFDILGAIKKISMENILKRLSGNSQNKSDEVSNDDFHEICPNVVECGNENANLDSLATKFFFEMSKRKSDISYTFEEFFDVFKKVFDEMPDLHSLFS